MPRRICTLASSLILLTGILCSTAAADNDTDARGHHFIRRTGRNLFREGKPFRVAGASNYYLMYSSQFMVDSLLTTAAASEFNVVRMWGSLPIGNADGTNCVEGSNCLNHNGVYFQFWDGTAPAFNDGPSGLQHLDYVLYKAGQLDLKVIIPFVNNWNAFGGMDQYVRWNNGQFHDQFYTDPTIRQWYKDWVNHLLNHTNMYTGIKYKDDATVLGWELANEPRCSAFGFYPRSPTCTSQTLVTWADEMSRYVKSIDKQHLLSAGDEGFYCTDPTSNDFTINCSDGVDTLALADLPKMDAMSFHLYPDNWGKDPSFGTPWILRHIQDGRRIHERVLLGEFAIKNKAIRNPLYKEWTDTILANGGGGALYWILSDKQDGGTLYPDFDGFTVYCPSPVCTTFTNFSKLITFDPPFDFSPVADDDHASTNQNTPVTLTPLTNDVTYFGATLKPDSIDLDLATPGVQSQLTTAFGIYTAQPDGSVLFSPAIGFSGFASTPYTVMDNRGRTSHPATMFIQVKGTAVYSFEDGTETWTAASFNAAAGTTSQSTNFATDGTHSLQIAVPPNQGGWFGPALTAPLPLSLTNVNHILMDITTTTSGTSQSVALQVGSDFHWCQTDFGFINANTSTTIDVNVPVLLSSVSSCLGSLPADKSVTQAIWVFFNDGGSGAGGTFYLDNVRTTQ